MAEDWLKFKDDNFTCNICMHYYENPKQLDCTHGYCEPCLSKLIKNSRITCPECRRVTFLKNSCTSDLNPNLQLCRLLEEVNLKIDNKNTEHKCGKHRQLLNFYCETCNVPICGDCLALDHPKPEHSNVDLSRAAERERKNIENKVAAAIEKVDTLEGMEKQLIEKRNKITVSNEAAKKKLSDTRDRWIKQIEYMYEKNLREIEEMFNDKDRIISKLLSSIQSSIAELKSSRDLLLDLQENKDDYGIVCTNNSAILLKPSEVNLPIIPDKQISEITFKPNTEGLRRLKALPGQLGKTVDQQTSMKVTLGYYGKDVTEEMKRFVVKIIQESYTTDQLPFPDRKLDVRQAVYITNKMTEKYGSGWTCIFGGYHSIYYYGHYFQQMAINESDFITVFKVNSKISN